MFNFHTTSVAETEEFGRTVAHKIRDTFGNAPCFLALEGDLGAGKTAFVRGFADVLSPGSRVKSPTYTIVNEYRKGPFPVFHFDLYRLADPDELDSIGFDEYLMSGICIAEWSEKLGDRRPETDIITITIRKAGESDRDIIIDWPGGF